MNQPTSTSSASLIIRTACGWTKAFILLYGIQIVLYGHLTPGGGFAGGVVAAAAFVLVMLAEGEQAGLKSFSRKAASTWDSLGALVFIGVAVIGLVLAKPFFVNFLATHESAYFTCFSGGVIPISNIGIGLKVCSSLYLVFIVLAAMQCVLRTSPENAGESP